MTKLAIVGATGPHRIHLPAEPRRYVRLPQANFHIIGQCHYRAETRRLIGHRHLGLPMAG
jgi:hypothetical protein